MAMAAAACTDDGGEAGGGSPGGVAAPDLQLASSLQPIESCDDLSTWLRDEVAPRVTEYGLASGGPIAIEVQEDAARAEIRAAPESAVAAADSATSAAEPSPSDGGTYSGTNVQVAGVDEPDIVKTDGERILAVAGGRLHLVSVAEGRELAALELPGELGITDLLLAGDRALVVGSSWTAVPFAEDTPGGAIPDDGGQPRIAGPSVPTTVVAEVDIAGDALTLGDTFTLDGSYVSARMTDDVVRLVLRSSPADALPFVSPANGSEGAIAAARDHNRQVVEEVAPEDVLPRWHQLGADGAPTDEGALLGCEDVQAPNTFAGFAMVAVASIDIGDGLAAGVTDPGATAVLAEGGTVYASPEHLFVAAPAWTEPQPVPPVADIEDAPQVTQPGTDIHRFDISDPARAVYDMSGHVDGTLLGQFALDEHDGHLRVATTTGFSWAGEGEDVPPSESHVEVLAPGDGALERGGPGQRPRTGRGHPVRALHRRPRLRRDVRAHRPPVHARPLRPGRATGGGRARDPRLLGVPASGGRRLAARRRPGRHGRGPHDRDAGVAVRRPRPRRPHPAWPRSRSPGAGSMPRATTGRSCGGRMPDWPPSPSACAEPRASTGWSASPSTPRPGHWPSGAASPTRARRAGSASGIPSRCPSPCRSRSNRARATPACRRVRPVRRAAPSPRASRRRTGDPVSRRRRSSGPWSSTTGCGQCPTPAWPAATSPR